ncbi:MAG: hypothetical protein ACE5QW_07725 [Thermoplasmata archaeon]
MPEEEEIEDVIDSIRDLGNVADLVRCPNCGEVTETTKNVCESCGYLIRGPKRGEEKESPVEEKEFQERLTMTLKPVIPSKPKVVPSSERVEREKTPEVMPEISELVESLKTALEPLEEAKLPRRIARRTPAHFPRRSNQLVIFSTLILIAGIATYLLSFFLVSDRMLAGAAMVLGALLIVIFGNVAVESALASRRPVLAAEGPRRKMIQYACPVCKAPLKEEELECPICGSTFES